MPLSNGILTDPDNQHINDGVRDQLEHYNSRVSFLLAEPFLIQFSVNRDIRKRQHPGPLRPFLPEIEAFARHNHENVLHPILRYAVSNIERHIHSRRLGYLQLVWNYQKKPSSIFMDFHLLERLLVSTLTAHCIRLKLIIFLSTLHEVVCRRSYIYYLSHCSRVIRARRKRKSKPRTFGSKDTRVRRSSNKSHL